MNVGGFCGHVVYGWVVHKKFTVFQDINQADGDNYDKNRDISCMILLCILAANQFGSLSLIRCQLISVLS